MRRVELDPIGPDPVAWVVRLMEVNTGSQFTAAQKTCVYLGLKALKCELARRAA